MTGRSQTILAGVSAVLVLLLVFFLMVRPRLAELGEVRDEIQTERDRTQQLQTELARLEALRDNAPQLEAELERIRRFVPASNEVSDFVLQVQQAADQAGVGFVQITPELPKPPPEGAPLAEVRMTIGAKGGYFALQDLIRRLYDLERAMRIDNLTMAGVEGEEAADGRVTLTLIGRIFFELPAGSAPAASATPAPGTTAPTTTTTPAPATTTTTTTTP